MAKFDVKAYREALQALQDNIDEMGLSMDGLEFEHGEGGISSRAETFANEIDGALTEAWDNLATVRTMIEENA